MTGDQPWYTLNIDKSHALRKDVDLDRMFNESQFADQPGGVWHWKDTEVHEILNINWIDDMNKLGIPVSNAMIFYRKPFYMHPEAHIDVRWDGTPMIGAINWVLEPNDDSEMVWYDFPPDLPSDGMTLAETKYSSWPLSQIDPYQIASRTIGNTPTLVSTSIPHNVVTRSKPRWCVSVRYKARHLQTWTDTVKFFRPWINNADSQR